MNKSRSTFGQRYLNFFVGRKNIYKHGMTSECQVTCRRYSVTDRHFYQLLCHPIQKSPPSTTIARKVRTKGNYGSFSLRIHMRTDNVEQMLLSCCFCQTFSLSRWHNSFIFASQHAARPRRLKHTDTQSHLRHGTYTLYT